MVNSLIFRGFAVLCGTIVATSQAVAVSLCPHQFTLLGYASEKAYWETSISGECSAMKTISVYDMKAKTTQQLYEADFDIIGLKKYLAKQGKSLSEQEQNLLEKVKQYPHYKQTLMDTLGKANVLKANNSSVYALNTKDFKLQKNCTNNECEAVLIEQKTGCKLSAILKQGDHYILNSFPKQIAQLHHNIETNTVFMIANHCHPFSNDCNNNDSPEQQSRYHSQSLRVFDSLACFN